jgi:hypothetical protein
MITLPVPTEDEEQIALFDWANRNLSKYPDLEWLYHNRNGGKLSGREAAKFQRMGVKAGVPDITLPVPVGPHHGLYIEMKRTQGGRVTVDQKKWLIRLKANGYKTATCRGWIEAKGVIEAYLNEKKEEHHEQV